MAPGVSIGCAPFGVIVPRIAAHFVSAEVRHFASAERSAALDWLRAAE